MKYYTFFPGFIIVTIIMVLVVLNRVFNLNLPILKNMKNPFIVLIILGFMMCAFGTLGHSFSNITANGKIDMLVIGMIITGVLILTVSGLAIFSKTSVLGFITRGSAFYIVAGLILLKIVLSTVRILRIN